MTTTSTRIPETLDKTVREVAQRWLDGWGATYEGDTSDGHHVFRFPNGAEATLSHSPSARRSFIKARMHEAYKLTGQPYKGKRNAQRVKDRAARVRERNREQVKVAVTIVRERQAVGLPALSQDELWGLTAKRYHELRSIQHLMGARGSIF